MADDVLLEGDLGTWYVCMWEILVPVCCTLRKLQNTVGSRYISWNSPEYCQQLLCYR